MWTNQTNAATQALHPGKLLSMQISVVGPTLGTIGFLATVTSHQATGLRGPLPLGGFTMPQIAWAISAVAILAYLLVAPVLMRVARTRMAARSTESSPAQVGTLLTLYTVRLSVSVVLLNAVVGACGAAHLVEHDIACLGAASAATLLALCHIPRPNRMSLWVERQLRLIDEARQVRRLTANF